MQEIEDANAYYDELGTQSDLREPHRIPQQFFRGLFEKEIPTLPPAPVIAFINSRSGGHAGPELSVALRRALGSTQVCFLEPVVCCPFSGWLGWCDTSHYNTRKAQMAMTR